MTDVLMPGKRGLELISELRETWPNIRMIYVSGSLHEPRLAKELEREIAAHPECQAIGKPFQLDDILRSIEQASKE